MRRLFDSADEYLRRSTWRDLAVLKICLLALGTLLGMGVSQKARPRVGLLAGIVFLLTYVPLMGKYIGVVADMGKGRQ